MPNIPEFTPLQLSALRKAAVDDLRARRSKGELPESAFQELFERTINPNFQTDEEMRRSQSSR